MPAVSAVPAVQADATEAQKFQVQLELECELAALQWQLTAEEHPAINL